jgi:hypothetical protein
MAKRFYYQLMGEIFGPLSGIELRDKALSGDVTPDTLVRINEDGDWVSAARIKNLFDERGRAISHSAILGTHTQPNATAAAPDAAVGTSDAAVGTPDAAPAAAAESTAQQLGGPADVPSDGIDFRPDRSEANTIGELPDVPALYALYGGRGDHVFAAYVGITDDLRARIEQHLIRRDSSLATGTSAVSLNPDYVTEVRWWTHPTFLEPTTLEAARLIAFDVIEPALRGGSHPPDEARRLYNEPPFVARMMELIKERPAGHLVIRSLDDAWDRIDDHQRRLADLERRLARLEGSGGQ